MRRTSLHVAKAVMMAAKEEGVARADYTLEDLDQIMENVRPPNARRGPSSIDHVLRFPIERLGPCLSVRVVRFPDAETDC